MPDRQYRSETLPCRALLLAVFSGFSAVALGAFGTHGLESRLSADQLETWTTATRYLMWHALAVIGLSRLPGLASAPMALICGALLFSLSLYLWALTGLTWLPLFAPIGGAIMLAGWATVFWKLLRAS